MDGALLAHEEAGAYLHAASPQRQRGGKLPPVGDAARRNDGHVHSVHHLRHQRHGSHFAHVAAALGALGNDGVDAQRLQVLGQHGCGHHGDYLDARGFPHGHIFAGVARAGGDDLDAFLHHDLGKFIGLWVHQHDVHAEGLVGQLLAAADILAQGVGVHAARADDAQCSCIGTGGGKLAGGDVGHAALNDGVLRPQNFVQQFHIHSLY